jgi:hypothetical protein
MFFFAYVDPGFFGSFYQAAYVLVFGVLLGWVLKPYQFLKALFARKDRDRQASADGASPSGPERGSAHDAVRDGGSARPSRTP